jgi:hypothetical protein
MSVINKKLEEVKVEINHMTNNGVRPPKPRVEFMMALTKNKG